MLYPLPAATALITKLSVVAVEMSTVPAYVFAPFVNVQMSSLKCSLEGGSMYCRLTLPLPSSAFAPDALPPPVADGDERFGPFEQPAAA
jgi:hypothetical protein